ncbi:MAG: hypothetical protein Fur0037_06260 [Planctomycetota bacterium]
MFQYADGLWNHGEGFVAGANDQDTGGWHALDDGTQVTWADVHWFPYNDPSIAQPALYGWHNHTWTGLYTPVFLIGGDATQPMLYPIHPDQPQPMNRLVGYLRPAGVPRNQQPHPLYRGNVTVPFVDDAAFEVFRPLVAWNGTDDILITIGCFGTLLFPGKHSGSGTTADPHVYTHYYYPNTYPGAFSPDGLIRNESQSEAAGFAANVDADSVARASSDQIVGSWYARYLATNSTGGYYPVSAYIVPPIIHRPVELEMQRNLQLVQAIKLMLRNDPQLVGRTLTQNEVDAHATVVFIGGSNGGFLAQMGPLLHPEVVHGGYSQVFNPSLERLLGEHEMGLALGRLSGLDPLGSVLEAMDGRNWGQFAWNRGLEYYDLSIPRRFYEGDLVRPLFLYCGDEDITTTGTDWFLPLMLRDATNIPLPSFPNVEGSAGIAQSPSTNGLRLAFASGEKADHNWREIPDPYNGYQPILWNQEREFFGEAVQQAAQSRAQNLAMPALLPFGRAANDLRGPEDPHEWCLGRLGAPAAVFPQSNPPLVYDQSFFDAVQPGAAGTWLGHKESLLIAGEHVYVGGTEGIVSRFHVDWNDPKKPLIRDAQSAQLGHEAWGLLALPGGDLIVGTRRHLHRLHADLSPTNIGPVQLSFEQAKPRRMHLASVGGAWTGSNAAVLFASEQGGLVAFDQNLNYIGEYPEPGVQDFLVTGDVNGLSQLTLLSERGVLANVTIDLSLPPGQSRGALYAASSPQNGLPRDLEMAMLSYGSNAFPGTVALYSGDDLGVSVRPFDPSSLLALPPLAGIKAANAGIGTRLDLAAVHWAPDQGTPGDHILVLMNDSLLLYDQYSTLVGEKTLFGVDPIVDPVPNPNGLPECTAGLHACAIAVGELGDGAAGTYPEEIVVGTESGHLLWLNANDLAAVSGTLLPAEFQMHRGNGSIVQPHTNQALSCAWGIGEDPIDPTHLHLFDQDGNHWRVDHGGTRELMGASAAVAMLARQVRGVEYLGMTGAVGGLSQAQNPRLTWFPFLAPFPTAPIQSRVYRPKDSPLVMLERYLGGSTSTYLHNNWVESFSGFWQFDGFAMLPRTGDLLVDGTQSHLFWWSDPPLGSGVGPWGNLAQGMRLAGAPGSRTADGIWASTDDTEQTGGRHAYLDLRNVTQEIPSLEQESLRVVKDPATQQLYVILGCPGGRVRVVRPGSYRVGSSAGHGLGQIVASSGDYGHGGSALAVEPGVDGVDIYFGVVVRNATVAGSYPTSSLGDTEVMTGRVVKFRFSFATNALTETWVRDLEPSAADPRGGYGVVGLYVDELFVDPLHPAEKEVVVTTLAGDVFVLSESNALLFRASVPGAAGFYNSILARDLDLDGRKELYIAGSMGLHRFVRTN